jgi:hypothetical protein
VGDTLKAVVINLDSNEKKIGLSLRALIQSEEQGDVSSYMDNQEGRSVVLGDVLKKKFEETNISFSDGGAKSEDKDEDKGEEDSEEKGEEKEE